MNNPPCPHCGGNTVRKGKNRNGTQRWQCKVCAAQWSDSNAVAGRKPIQPIREVCPHCGSGETIRNGNDRARCKSCWKTWKRSAK